MPHVYAVLPPAPELVALREEGLTLAQIGARYGVGKTAVLGAIRRAGIPAAPPPTLEERFWSKVDKNGPVPEYAPQLGPCWLWTGALDGHGYGHFRADGGTRKAYRVSYELAHGAVPEGRQLDHLCRVTACVNPAHLEPVTQRENILRGTSVGARNAVATHCIRGHEFTEANTIVQPDGRRNCRACRPIYRERYSR